MSCLGLKLIQRQTGPNVRLMCDVRPKNINSCASLALSYCWIAVVQGKKSTETKRVALTLGEHQSSAKRLPFSAKTKLNSSKSSKTNITQLSRRTKWKKKKMKMNKHESGKKISFENLRKIWELFYSVILRDQQTCWFSYESVTRFPAYFSLLRHPTSWRLILLSSSVAHSMQKSRPFKASAFRSTPRFICVVLH